MSILSDELTNDPLARGYGAMTDQEAADDLNTVYREAPDTGAILEYLVLESYRGGSLFGRISMVARSLPVKDGNSWQIPPVPFGAGDADVTVDQSHVSIAAALLMYVQPDFHVGIPITEARLDAAFSSMVACEAIQLSDKTALAALVDNQQSRGNELGIGHVKTGHVQQARA